MTATSLIGKTCPYCQTPIITFRKAETAQTIYAMYLNQQRL